MGADIVASAVSPDYAVTDHTGKRRKLSDLQGPEPGGSAPGRGSTRNTYELKEGK